MQFVPSLLLAQINVLEVGYHNEHHDFPNVAWGNLPKVLPPGWSTIRLSDMSRASSTICHRKVRDMAPEFYDHLPRCKSWLLPYRNKCRGQCQILRMLSADRHECCALQLCTQRTGTLLRYIFDDSISPYSRVKRNVKKRAPVTQCIVSLARRACSNLAYCACPLPQVHITAAARAWCSVCCR